MLAVLEKAGEEVDQVVSFLGRERGEQFVLRAGYEAVELAELPRPAGVMVMTLRRPSLVSAEGST